MNHRNIPALPVLLISLTLWGLAGCGSDRPAAEPSPTLGRAASGELTLTLEVDRPAVRVGETLGVRLTARNSGSEPIRIDSPTGARMLVTVWRRQWNGWARVKEYPEAAIQVLTSWTLEAGREQTFRMDVPVQPDWPVMEQVRLTGELNGRPEARPEVLIRVLPAE